MNGGRGREQDPRQISMALKIGQVAERGGVDSRRSAITNKRGFARADAASVPVPDVPGRYHNGGSTSSDALRIPALHSLKSKELLALFPDCPLVHHARATPRLAIGSPRTLPRLWTAARSAAPGKPGSAAAPHQHPPARHTRGRSPVVPYPVACVK